MGCRRGFRCAVTSVGTELAEALGNRRFNEEGLVPAKKSIIETAQGIASGAEGRRLLVTFRPVVLYARIERTISSDSKITVGELQHLASERMAETTGSPEP